MEEARLGMRLPSCCRGDPARLNKAISHRGNSGILAAAGSVGWHGNRTEAERQTDESFQLSVNKVNAGCKVQRNVQTQE